MNKRAATIEPPRTVQVHDLPDLQRRLESQSNTNRPRKIQFGGTVQEIQERPSLIVHSLPIATYIADLNGNFSGPRFLSEGIANSIGFKPDAFIQDSGLWATRIHPDDLARFHNQIAHIGDTGSMAVEYRWLCADESERVFLDQAVLIRDQTGAPKEIHGTCLDITNRRQLELQLLQSQRMDAVGQLTSSLAHDFNNMLSVIIWNLDLLDRSMGGIGKEYEYVQTAMGGALNCAELIRQLLTFAHQKPHHGRIINLCDLVPRAALRASPLVGEKIKMNVALPDTNWPIYADPAQIESAILNLAINARDAMPDGGTITIECVDVHCEAIDFEHDPEGPPPGAYVMISVTDTGIGMPQDLIGRVFEPCFTTKEPGKGSGLGLSMVYRFVKQSGGHVKIESTLGIGTTVRIYLPESNSPREEPITLDKNSDLPMPHTDHVILVVEDNANIRRMAVVHLREIGYRVLEAPDAKTALEILQTDQQIDLLFTDVVIPGGMDGFALARICVERRPAIKVLFTSGYISSDRHIGGMSEAFLQKPYREEELRQALKSVILKNSTERTASLMAAEA